MGNMIFLLFIGFWGKILRSQPVRIHAKTNNGANTMGGKIGYMAEIFARKNIADMYFNYRCINGFYGITQRNRSMGISTCI